MTAKTTYTFDDTMELTLHIARRAEYEGFIPEMIVGPNRGGLVPGVILSHYFNVKFIPIIASLRDYPSWYANRTVLEAVNEGKKILIVDDILDSGLTVINIHKDYDLNKNENVKFGVLLCKGQEKQHLVHYIGEVINQDRWVIFPWEITK